MTGVPRPFGRHGRTLAVVLVTALVVLAPVSPHAFAAGANVEQTSDGEPTRQEVSTNADQYSRTGDRAPDRRPGSPPAVWTPPQSTATQPDGALSVRVNAGDSTVTGAIVVLYDGDWTHQDTKQVTETGTVSWTDIRTGQYHLELYGPDGDFWGARAVTVTTGGTETELRRTAPQVSDVEFVDISGSPTVTPGDTVTVSPMVRNDGPERAVRVRIAVDSNADGTADATVVRGGTETRIETGEGSWYGYDTVPETTGPVRVRVETQTLVGDNWVQTDRTDWREVFRVVEPFPTEDLSVSIRSVDGNSRQNGVFTHDGHVENVTMAVAYGSGNPVRRSELTLTVETLDGIGDSYTTTLTRNPNGTFEATFPSDVYTGVSTQYWRLVVSTGDSSHVVEPPIVDEREPLNRPIAGWTGSQTLERVRVNGNQYTALELRRDSKGESGDGGDRAWLVLHEDGTPVTDESIRRRAATAAQVSSNVGTTYEHQIEMYGETLPSGYEDTVTYARLGDFFLTVRDTAAELAGAVVATSATGGTSRFAGESVEQSTRYVAREMLEDVTQNYLESQVLGIDVESNPVAAMEKAIRLKAESELLSSADQSRQAAAILRDRNPGTPWTYEEAERYWELVNESSVDGYFYMTVRANMMPDADAATQLGDVATAAVQGGTGLPVDKIETVVSLIEGDQFGYLSEAAKETGELRSRRAAMARAFGEHGSEAQQAALSQYGENTVFYGSSRGEQASISLVSTPNDEFRTGDTVTSTVSVTNTGSTDSTFFVGYGPWTTVDGSREYFSNHGRTGHVVRVPAGETTTTNVTWTVQSSAPSDQSYGVGAAVWTAKPPSDDATRLDDATRADAFRVVGSPDVTATALDLAAPATAGEPATIEVALRNDGDAAGQTTVNVAVNGTVVGSRTAAVGAGETSTVRVYHVFDAKGEHVLEAEGVETVVDVEPAQETGEDETTGTSTITECRAITEPGQYELTGDLRTDGTSPCLHVRSDDVTLDGNGHAVSGSGAADSVGVLVYNASRGESVDQVNALGNVTVSDLAVENWADGVAVGDMSGTGTSVTLRDVVVRDNADQGVDLTEVENATLVNVTAIGNRHGVTAWEVSGTTMRNLTANRNAEVGVALFQDVRDTRITGLTATENGPGGYATSGIYFSTDVENNVVTDAYVANNDGNGVRFSDSSGNVLRNAVVESNTGPGIHGIPANDDRLQNVTTRANGGSELLTTESRSRFSADDLDIDGVATVTFESEPVNIEPFDATQPPKPDAGSVATDRGVNVTDVDGGVDVTFAELGDDSLELWRFDGTGWTPVSDSTRDPESGTVSGTVTADGLVVPLQTGDDGGTDGTMTTTDDATTTSTTSGATTMTGDDTTIPTETTTTTGATTADTTTTETTTTETTTTETTPTAEATTDTTTRDGDASTFVVSSTRSNHDFGYVFVVDGDVERSNTETLAADDTDRIVDSGDGTMTVIGSTGDQSGDAYRVTGDITVFYTPATLTEYALLLDGEDVTDELPRPNE